MKAHRSKILLFIWLLILPGTVIIAQKYTGYDVTAGLPSNHVYRITQDSDGFIWAITDKGMARFNGSEFKAYTTRSGLPKNDIWDISITPDKRIWYFTKAREMGFIKGDDVRSFPSEDGEASLFPSVIHQYNSDVFFGYNRQSFHFKDSLWRKIDETYREENKIYLKYLDNRYTINEYIRNRGEPTFLIRVKDSLGFLLFREGYTIMNFKSNQLLDKKYPDKLLGKNTGLFRFHAVNGGIQLTGPDFVTTLNRNYDLNEIVTIPKDMKSHFSMIDRSGNIWIATFSNGMYKLPEVKRNVQYSLNDQKLNEISRVDDHLYASVYGKGFYKYNPATRKFDSFMDRDEFVYEASKQDYDKDIFFTSSKNVIRLDPSNGRVKFYPPVARKLCSFDGNLFGYVSSGLNRLDKDDLAILQHYPQVGIKSMEEFQGKLFLGTSSGLKSMDGGGIVSEATDLTDLQRPLLSIRRFGDEFLLVATDGFGVYITDLKSAELLPHSAYTSVQDMFIDKTSLWLASEEGVLEYGRNLTEFEFKRKWTSEDGLPSKNVNSVVVRENHLIAGTDKGAVVLSRFQSSTEQKMGVYVEAASYGGNNFTPGESRSFTPNGTLEFVVENIDFTESVTGSEIQYKLDPVQSDWITTGSSNISFSGIKPGDYRLRLRNGPAEATYEFQITPLWWQLTVTKIGASAALGLLLFWLLSRYRKYELAKRMAKLEVQKKLTEFELSALRSQMNPHFVFNSLAAIQYCINKNDLKAAENYLLKFSTLVRQFFELSQHNEISLDEEISLLTNYLDIEQLRFKERLEYEIHLNGIQNPHKKTIPTMLLQPIVENAVNHGIFNKVDGGRIDLRFSQVSENTIKVEVEDDGVGFGRSHAKLNGKRHSSSVLSDRIYFLNKTGKWNIEHNRRDAFPERIDKGNISSFVIRNIL